MALTVRLGGHDRVDPRVSDYEYWSDQKEWYGFPDG